MIKGGSVLAHDRIVYAHRTGMIDLEAYSKVDAVEILRGMGIQCNMDAMSRARSRLGIKPKKPAGFVSSHGISKLFKKAGWI